MDFKKNTIVSSNAGFYLFPLYIYFKYDNSFLTSESVNMVRSGEKVVLYYSKMK